jgi:hypothetical protein
MKKENTETDKEKKKTKRRWFVHLMSHLLFGFLGILFSQGKWEAFLIVCIILAYSIVYYGGYLLERIAISHNYSKNFFWILTKFLSVILNISISFTICYLIIINAFPNSISNPEVLGKTEIEKVFNVFHFSIGNFLGISSDISISGIPIKFLQIVQYFVSFSFLIFLFSNYQDIKESYSRYYTDEE